MVDYAYIFAYLKCSTKLLISRILVLQKEDIRAETGRYFALKPESKTQVLKFLHLLAVTDMNSI